MRQELIEALLYPNLLVRQLIEGGNYPHNSLLEATGERCHSCANDRECCWDTCLHDFRHFDEKTTEQLGEELREGIKLVEKLNNKLRHDETTCKCETCSWIRNAEHLTEEIEHHLPHAEPAMAAESAEPGSELPAE